MSLFLIAILPLALLILVLNVIKVILVGIQQGREELKREEQEQKDRKKIYHWIDSQEAQLADPGQSENRKRYCSHCGAVLSPDARFCTECGERTDWDKQSEE